MLQAILFVLQKEIFRINTAWVDLQGIYYSSKMPKHALLSHFSLFLQIYCREKSKCTEAYPLSLLQEASCIRVGSSGTHFRRDSRLLPFQQWKGMNPHAAPSVFAYHYGQITMVCETLVDIGWRSPVLLRERRNAPFPWDNSQNRTVAIIFSWRNWFVKNFCHVADSCNVNSKL